MDIHHQDFVPTPKEKVTKRRSLSIGTVVVIVCMAVALTLILTYTLTSASDRSYYTQKLIDQQKVINQLQSVEPEESGNEFNQLQLLADLFERYSYYSGKVSEEALLTAVLKAYAEATGDTYAEYYTDEEYRAISTEKTGDHVGIGVSIIQTTLSVDGYEYQVFQVIAVYQNSPAYIADVRVGDRIYAIKSEEQYKTIAELGGYSNALQAMQGKIGTQAEFAAFRPTESEEYQRVEFNITRDTYESYSVTGFMSEADPSIGIVRISSFDLTTPVQFKNAVRELQQQGAVKFVFDVRNNPGGDLQSIKAVLTYFLQKGDLILSSINKDGKVATSYCAESVQLIGDYASCNVSEEEIGMFAELDMVVLCNGNTASAAEVFTATLRDYELTEVVGENTFGKGIMQTYFPLSMFGDYTGCVKMTTYAYVTKCGETYHETGIYPTTGEEVRLSDEAMQYNFFVLPQSLDDQLIAAIAQLQ